MGGPLTIAQAPFGPRAILGVRRGRSVAGTQVRIMSGRVCSYGMTPQERTGLQ